MLGIPKVGSFIKDIDIININLSSMEIEKSIASKYSNRHRGSIRLSSEQYYTEEEFQKKKEKILAEPLP